MASGYIGHHFRKLNVQITADLEDGSGNQRKWKSRMDQIAQYDEDTVITTGKAPNLNLKNIIRSDTVNTVTGYMHIQQKTTHEDNGIFRIEQTTTTNYEEEIDGFDAEALEVLDGFNNLMNTKEWGASLKTTRGGDTRDESESEANSEDDTIHAFLNMTDGTNRHKSMVREEEVLEENFFEKTFQIEPINNLPLNNLPLKNLSSLNDLNDFTLNGALLAQHSRNATNKSLIGELLQMAQQEGCYQHELSIRKSHGNDQQSVYCLPISSVACPPGGPGGMAGGAGTTAAGGPAPAGGGLPALEDDDSRRMECKYCGRGFRSDRLQVHMQSCATRGPSRPVFDSKKQRLRQLPAAQNLTTSIDSKRSTGTVSTAASAASRRSTYSSKSTTSKTTSNKSTTRKTSTSYKEPDIVVESSLPDARPEGEQTLIPCTHCGREFRPESLPTHEKVCVSVFGRRYNSNRGMLQLLYLLYFPRPLLVFFLVQH